MDLVKPTPPDLPDERALKAWVVGAFDVSPSDLGFQYQSPEGIRWCEALDALVGAMRNPDLGYESRNSWSDVRTEVAQSLLALHDDEAIPKFVALVAKAPTDRRNKGLIVDELAGVIRAMDAESEVTRQVVVAFATPGTISLLSPTHQEALAQKLIAVGEAQLVRPLFARQIELREAFLADRAARATAVAAGSEFEPVDSLAKAGHANTWGTILSDADNRMLTLVDPTDDADVAFVQGEIDAAREIRLRTGLPIQ